MLYNINIRVERGVLDKLMARKSKEQKMTIQEFYRNNRKAFRKAGGYFEIKACYLSLMYQDRRIASITIDDDYLLRLDDTILGFMGAIKYFELVKRDM